MHSFLEPLHSDHVFGQFELFALGLNGELPMGKEMYINLLNSLTSLTDMVHLWDCGHCYPASLSSVSWSVM